MSADHTALQFVTGGTAPVGFQADPSGVTIGAQGGDLTGPIDGALAQLAPGGSVALDGAIFGVDVDDARRRKLFISTGERILTRHQGVGGIPNEFQMGMRERGEQRSALRGGADVAGMFVFEADRQAVRGCLAGQIAQGFHNPGKASRRFDGAPVREYPDDAGTGAAGDLEGAGGEAGLIGEGVAGGEHVFLEARVHFGSVRQDTPEHRRGDGNNAQAGGADDGDGAVQFLIGEIDDVFAEYHAQLGAGHADGGHGGGGDLNVGREFIGDGGNRVWWHESFIIEAGSNARIAKMPHIASSVENVPYSRIRELGEMALGMDDVLRLYFGESNLPTPDYIKQAAMRALEDGYTYYTENAGLPSLRRAIAENYRRLQGVELDPKSEIVVTASGVQALNMGIRCALDPRDEALVLTPAWPNGSSSVMMANACVRQIPQPLSDERYGIDFDALEAAVTPRTRLLLYTSPSNPLGWVASEEEQQQLLDFARRHDLWLLADEVYDRLYYAGRELGDAAPSILRKATREDAVMVVHSFSKSYCMTGWRLGWLVARRDLAAKATQLNEFVISHAPSFAQKAGETALADGEPELRRMLERLEENRDLCLEALSGCRGVTAPRPDGAFYLFPRIEGLDDSFTFCRRLLEETRVGLAPGVAFGAGGEGSIRICYAAESSILEPAMERLTRFLRGGA